MTARVLLTPAAPFWLRPVPMSRYLYTLKVIAARVDTRYINGIRIRLVCERWGMADDGRPRNDGHIRNNVTLDVVPTYSRDVYQTWNERFNGRPQRGFWHGDLGPTYLRVTEPPRQARRHVDEAQIQMEMFA